MRRNFMSSTMTQRRLENIIFLGMILSLEFIDAQRYSRGYVRDGNGQGSCPVQCRCIALSHLGYRGMAQRWQSMGQLHGMDNTIWRGTEAPVWQKDASTLQGRDMVCLGLGRIPRPLPSDLVKLTVFGDSSNVAPPSDPVSVNSLPPDDANGNGQSQLTYINWDSFQNTENLRELTLSGNRLSILHPYIFRRLVNLEYLSLQNNNIRHISSATFNGLIYLKELRLSDNVIMFLSPMLFKSLTKLRFLYLNGNTLQMIHRDLFRNLWSLEHLDLSRNNFTDLYDDVFDGAVNLKELLINENRLWTIRPRWFQSLASLKNLELQGNKILRIDPSSFKSLFNLEMLTLSANSIQSISDGGFQNLETLKKLDISANNIDRLGPHSFAGLVSLDELDLSMNMLSFVDNKTFNATPSLTKLDLSHNHIGDIEQAALHTLVSLQDLDLSHNSLKIVRRKTFTGLLELKEVNLENNAITRVEDDAFVVAPLNQLSMITWLSLQYNKISELNAYSFFALPHLKFLNLAHNKIKGMHEKTFYTLGSLQNLMMNNNRIKSLKDGQFSRLKMLYSFNFDHNRLTEISDNMLLGLKSLDDLSIASNEISDISSEAFVHTTQLTRLNLKDNDLSKINFNMFSMKKLNVLDLSDNHIFTVEFPTHQTLELRHFTLTNNKLQTISRNVTNVLSRSGLLSLDENPWSCDCNIQWLVRYIKHYRIRLRGTRDTICQSPVSLYGRKVTGIPPEELQCSNRTYPQSIACQHVQLQEGYVNDIDMRKAKNGVRKWHVTFQSRDASQTKFCNGVLVNNNWALTRLSCARDNLPSNKDLVRVKVGGKRERSVLMAIDYPSGALIPEFDLTLVRLSPDHKVLNFMPCILSHHQFHDIARVVDEAAFALRVQDKKKNRFRSRAKAGKLSSACLDSSSVCVKVRSKSNGNGITLEGSGLFLNYQGIWFLSGLGSNNNSTNEYTKVFTPLWNAADWLNAVIYEVDSKCTFKNFRGERTTVCNKPLNIPGITNRGQSA